MQRLQGWEGVCLLRVAPHHVTGRLPAARTSFTCQRSHPTFHRSPRGEFPSAVTPVCRQDITACSSRCAVLVDCPMNSSPLTRRRRSCRESSVTQRPLEERVGGGGGGHCTENNDSSCALVIVHIYMIDHNGFRLQYSATDMTVSVTVNKETGLGLSDQFERSNVIAPPPPPPRPPHTPHTHIPPTPHAHT